MSKAAGIVAVIMTIVMGWVYFENASSKTPNIQTEGETYPWDADECTESLAVQCAVDIELTVKSCAKAFETEGADVVADIKCAKDLLSDKKNCWPCICFEAKKRGWHIIGC